MTGGESAQQVRRRNDLVTSWQSTRLVAILGLALAILSTALSPAAQPQGKVPRIGYIWIGPEGSDPATRPGLQQGLRELGYNEGRDIVEYRYADGNLERLRELVSDMVASKVDIIIATGAVVADQVKYATTTIPVVAGTGDPLRSGLVASLARPGGNITGFSAMIPELGGKYLELLHELVPRAVRVAVLWNPTNGASQDLVHEMREAAGAFGLSLLLHEVRQSADLPIAFEAIVRQTPDALVIDTDALLISHRNSVVEFAAVRQLPAMYGLREFFEVGGLMSYGADIFDGWRRVVAGDVDKILRGAKPDDLPVQQPTKFELLVNLKTAKALGLTIPPSMLARADEVIE